MAYSSNYRLCLDWRRLRATAEQRRHDQMNMHCAVGANRLRRMLESMHRWPREIRQFHDVRNLKIHQKFLIKDKLVDIFSITFIPKS